MGGEQIVEVEDLVVEYGRGRNVVRAVDGVSFSVARGECVGFIGANGAGKSSTIKTMMGFLFPAAGSVTVFGEKAGTTDSRRRMGYLPEVALYYPFMKARELLELYGGLAGLSRAALRQRIPTLLAELGLEGRGESLLKNFSKGMQQRLGIAQAIIADPELLVFDELSSGLDPLGRFDLRQVLLEIKQRGRTIFFSSHELSEVESLCDRVVIVDRGRVVKQAPMAEMMGPLTEFEVLFRMADGAAPPPEVAALQPDRDGESLRVVTRDAAVFAGALEALAAAGARIISTSNRSRSLEEYFINLVRPAGNASATESPAQR
jgi:ABC-2 type transport system ATP-binding protein